MSASGNYHRRVTTEVNELGAFLRASRSRTAPSDVGLPGGASGRRVVGLRREEVAVSAGVSADYYARLEQGRERNPSPSVMESVGRALRLDPDGRQHLFRLAGLAPRSASQSPNDTVHPALMSLLEQFPSSAAYVLSPAFDVLARNTIADALLRPFAPETSMPLVLFTHPEARHVFAEWEAVADATVRALRLNAGAFPGDAAISTIVERLEKASPEFERLWSAHAVGSLSRAYKVFVHPEVGRIELSYQTFSVQDAPGQQLMVGSPVKGTRGEEALAYLHSRGTAFVGTEIAPAVAERT